MVVVAHDAFNPGTWEAEAGGFLSLASLVYRVSSKIARATQRNPVSENQKKKKKKKRYLMLLSFLVRGLMEWSVGAQRLKEDANVCLHMLQGHVSYP